MNLGPIIKVFSKSIEKCGCTGSFTCKSLKPHLRLLKMLVKWGDFKDKHLDHLIEKVKSNEL